MQTWRKFTNAVLSVLVLAGMVITPSLGSGGAAYAQNPGDTRTVQQETGTRTDTASDISASYDAKTGTTTYRRQANVVRLYNERTESYKQTGTTTETRYRQDPVYQTRYRKEARTRVENQQVARTGTRYETRYETRYRPVYVTKSRVVARTAYRNETRYRSELQSYWSYGYRWETRYRYRWQWVTRYSSRLVYRWYYSPGYWWGYWYRALIYPGCYYGYRWGGSWFRGYWYGAYAWETYAYSSCELVAAPYSECVGYWYTAYRWATVAYTVSAPYTYYETEYYQEQVQDLVGWTPVYGWRWTRVGGYWGVIYPGCYYGWKASYGWRYEFLRNDPIYAPRQEAYQVPVTVAVQYTYYETVPVTVTYYVDVPYQVQTGTVNVPYQVVVPVYGWVANGGWVAKEQTTGTTWATLGRSSGLANSADAAGAGKAKSSTFLSDRGTGTAKTALAGVKVRTLFKADNAIASAAKVAKKEEGTIRLVLSTSAPILAVATPNPAGVVPGTGNRATPAPTPAPTATPAPTPAPTAAPAALTIDDWAGTFQSDTKKIVITLVTNSGGQKLPRMTVYQKNGNSDNWRQIAQDTNPPSGSMSNGSTYNDPYGPAFYTSGNVTISRKDGKIVLSGKLVGSDFSGDGFKFDSLAKQTGDSQENDND